MKKSSKRRPSARKKRSITTSNPFALRPQEEADRVIKPQLHIYGKGVVCETDTRGHSTPDGRSRAEIIVDTPNGVVPLWDREVTLRWRFQEQSLARFEDPDAAKVAMRSLLGKALLAWDDAVPVTFVERHERWDFELAVAPVDKCTNYGCVLARAFFPDSGRHDLMLYPKLFEQETREQVDTLVHELGHVFGLRHFFAQIKESAYPSEVFGKHDPFSIMNYGHQSTLTAADKSDLRRLYQEAWARTLVDINGTEITFVKPFSARA